MQRPVLSLLALRQSAGGRQLLLQRRRKLNDDTPYSGLLELPQGRISDRQTVHSFAEFKLRDETGLSVVRYLIGEEASSPSGYTTSEITISDPFCCVVDAVQNHFAVSIVVLVDGEPQPSRDADDHRWCGLRYLDKVMAERQVFPLNAPMIRRLMDRSQQFDLAETP